MIYSQNTTFKSICSSMIEVRNIRTRTTPRLIMHSWCCDFCKRPSNKNALQKIKPKHFVAHRAHLNNCQQMTKSIPDINLVNIVDINLRILQSYIQIWTMRIFLDSNFELMGQKINNPKSKKSKTQTRTNAYSNKYIYIYIYKTKATRIQI